MSESFLDAAHRHFGDGDLLLSQSRIDGAGHLYGVAGECAVKAVCIEESGGRPQKHFDATPGRDLRNAAVPNLVGRKGQRMRLLLPTLFANWSIHNRYAATGHTSAIQVQQWRLDAASALNVTQGI